MARQAGRQASRLLAACTATSNFFSSLAFATLILFAVDDLRLSDAAIGSLGALVGALVAGRLADWLGLGRTLEVASLGEPCSAFWSRWPSLPSASLAGDGPARGAAAGRPAGPPTAPTATAPRTPVTSAIAPPVSEPSGKTPQTTKGMEAFMRPSRRSGVIDWRRLSWLMP